MEIRDYLRVLQARWKIIVAVAVLAVVLAGLTTVLSTKQYQASAQLFVSTTGAGDVGSQVQNNQFSSNRVTSYAELITGQQVAQRVVDQLGLDESPQALAAQVTTKVVPDTVLLTVTVTDPSPTRARDLANAVVGQFSGLVKELETPDGSTVAAAKATVVQRAEVPTAAVSPTPARNLGLGLVLGLLLGVGLAVLRDRLDNSVTDRRDVAEHTGAAVVGALPYDAERLTKPLITFSSGYSASAEAYRQLRTNLQFLDVDNPPKVLVMTSAVPGEGKTTTACNFAFALAESGHRVLLVEADLRRPRVARYLNLVESVGITNLLAGTADLDDVLQPTGNARVRVLASGPHPPNPSELLGSAHMQRLLEQLRLRYDYVIIDAPPLLPVTDAAVLTTLADGAILVARHGHTTREQLARAAENLAAVEGRLLGTVLNMIPAKAGAYEYAYYYESDGKPAAAEDPDGLTDEPAESPRPAVRRPQGWPLAPAPRNGAEREAEGGAHVAIRDDGTGPVPVTAAPEEQGQDVEAGGRSGSPRRR